ncbi:hypothetical protein T4B_9278, partial [Trichinella pseudospiralis]
FKTYHKTQKRVRKNAKKNEKQVQGQGLLEKTCSASCDDTAAINFLYNRMQKWYRIETGKQTYLLLTIFSEMFLQQKLIILLYVCYCGHALKCYVCNTGPNQDDHQPCVEKIEECPEDVHSCTMVLYKTKNGAVGKRKFCTSSASPIHDYMRSFPDSTFCHKINTSTLSAKDSSAKPRPKNLATDTMPPAPPIDMKYSLVCVCNGELCNRGSHTDMVNSLMPESSVNNARMLKKMTNDEDYNVLEFK